MEIEDLKSALEKRVLSVASTAEKGESKFLLQESSLSGMSKLSQSLKWELIFSSTVSIAAVGLLIMSQVLSVQIFLSIVALYSFAFTFYLLQLYRKMQAYFSSLKPVRECIQDALFLLQRFMNLYIRLASGFIPGIFAAAFLASLADRVFKGDTMASLPWMTIGVSVPVIILWIFLMKKFTSWYLHRLFGNHLHLLKKNLADLSEESANVFA